MPLYWSTDKIIAKKHKVKKPMPLELYEYKDEKTHFINLYLFGKTFHNISTYEKDIFDTFEILLGGEDINTILGIQLSKDSNNNAVFLELAKEYLVEVNGSSSGNN
jgi:hypothetical protein